MHVEEVAEDKALLHRPAGPGSFEVARAIEGRYGWLVAVVAGRLRALGHSRPVGCTRPFLA